MHLTASEDQKLALFNHDLSMGAYRNDASPEPDLITFAISPHFLWAAAHRSCGRKRLDGQCPYPSASASSRRILPFQPPTDSPTLHPHRRVEESGSGRSIISYRRPSSPYARHSLLRLRHGECKSPLAALSFLLDRTWGSNSDCHLVLSGF